MARGFDLPQRNPWVTGRATVESSVCRGGRRTTGGQLLRANRLSPGRVAAITTSVISTGDLAWSHPDVDVHVGHGTVHAPGTHVEPDGVLRR